MTALFIPIGQAQPLVSEKPNVIRWRLGHEIKLLSQPRAVLKIEEALPARGQPRAWASPPLPGRGGGGGPPPVTAARQRLDGINDDGRCGAKACCVWIGRGSEG